MSWGPSDKEIRSLAFIYGMILCAIIAAAYLIGAWLG